MVKGERETVVRVFGGNIACITNCSSTYEHKVILTAFEVDRSVLKILARFTVLLVGDILAQSLVRLN